MTSVVEMEKRSQILRNQLSDLQYFQPLGLDSVPLVERLLGDLVKTVEAFQELTKQNESHVDQIAQLTKLFFFIIREHVTSLPLVFL